MMGLKLKARLHELSNFRSNIKNKIKFNGLFYEKVVFFPGNKKKNQQKYIRQY